MRRRRIDRTNKPPSFTERVPLKLVELPPPDELMRVHINGVNSYLRTYLLGMCTVIVTKEYGRWHLSIAGPERYPTWDEIAEARYRILPADVTIAMILPPRDRYININPHCFQMVEIDPIPDFPIGGGR